MCIRDRQLLYRASPQTLREVAEESRKRSRSASSYTPTPNTSVIDADQRRVAAGLAGVELAEEQRHRAAPKGFRAGLEAAALEADAGKGGKDRAEAMFKIFPQAAPANHSSKANGVATGARALQQPTTSRAEDRRRVVARHQAGSGYSDSSSDSD